MIAGRGVATLVGLPRGGAARAADGASAPPTASCVWEAWEHYQDTLRRAQPDRLAAPAHARPRAGRGRRRAAVRRDHRRRGTGPHGHAGAAAPGARPHARPSPPDARRRRAAVDLSRRLHAAVRRSRRPRAFLPAAHELAQHAVDRRRGRSRDGRPAVRRPRGRVRTAARARGAPAAPARRAAASSTSSATTRTATTVLRDLLAGRAHRSTRRPRSPCSAARARPGSAASALRGARRAERGHHATRQARRRRSRRRPRRHASRAAKGLEFKLVVLVGYPQGHWTVQPFWLQDRDDRDAWWDDRATQALRRHDPRARPARARRDRSARRRPRAGRAGSTNGTGPLDDRRARGQRKRRPVDVA